MNHHRYRFAVALPCAIAAVGAIYFALAPKTKPAQTTMLSFSERVAYQRAIEEVYWRHRLWPNEHSEKPSLDQVMSQAQLEKKVADYLRNSQALDAYWQRPITAEQLQAEMDRMAQHTKQPEVLRELFAALGNDPFVIAECLARSVLVERLLAHPSFDQAGQTSRTPSQLAAATANYSLPTISNTADGCVDDTWSATGLVNAPTGRTYHTAVWTGSEMIIWGGLAPGVTFNTGGRYNPATDSWTATSTANAPIGRAYHTAVWTGSEMIVWGGADQNFTVLNTGGRYHPDTDSWMATSTANAPAAREFHTAVWTGSEMIVWGGEDKNFAKLNTGARYDPSTDSWIATSITNAPAGRETHTAVWTGSQMIVWGGYNGSSNVNTGGGYNPVTNSWITTSTANAPDGREAHTAVWTGNEMIVWGGYNFGIFFGTGGIYSPTANSWTATNSTNAPSARYAHTAVWNGSEMIVWGGLGQLGELNSGGRYNPIANIWTATNTTGAPVRRDSHTAIWTGGEMIVWGGFAGNGNYLNTGGRYCAQSGPTPTPTPTPTATPTPTPVPSLRVNLSVSSTQINEGQTATYTVTASSTVTQSITVGYAMSGNATNGTDYRLSGTANEVTIPASQSSATVTLKSKTDGIAEGTETATMTLQPGSGYKVGRNNQATVSILDSP